MRHKHAETIKALNLWRDPPFYILEARAAYHAQLVNTVAARTAFDLYLRTRPSSYDNAIGGAAYLRIFQRQEGRDR